MKCLWVCFTAGSFQNFSSDQSSCIVSSVCFLCPAVSHVWWEGPTLAPLLLLLAAGGSSVHRWHRWVLSPPLGGPGEGEEGHRKWWSNRRSVPEFSAKNYLNYIDSDMCSICSPGIFRSWSKLFTNLIHIFSDLDTGKGDSKGGAKGEKTLNDFAVEYAKSNRSTCKGCEQKIEKVCGRFYFHRKKNTPTNLNLTITSNLQYVVPLTSPSGSDPCVQEICGPREAPAGSDRPLVPHGLFCEP